MKAIMIDHMSDEIQQFEQLILAKDNRFGLDVDVYRTPYEALTSILNELPNVVFLDVQTKDYNGLFIAEQIKNQAPEIHIVFVTTDKSRALEAFEVGATDYLLPPFTTERIQNTLQRLKTSQYTSKKLDTKVCCFGHLALYLPDGQILRKIPWRTKKAQEVFAYFLLNHEMELRKDVLVDLFWPHLDWNQGMNALYTTIYQIRKTLTTLQVNVVIDSRENMYFCQLNDVQYGPKQWEQTVGQLDTVNEKNIVTYMHCIYLYKGDFLGIHHYSWAEVERLRLRGVWLQLVEKVAAYLWEKKQYKDVVKIFHYVQGICPEGKKSYFYLMQIYAYLENTEGVIANYQALTSMLESHYDEEPSEEVQEWFLRWCRKSSKYLDEICE